MPETIQRESLETIRKSIKILDQVSITWTMFREFKQTIKHFLSAKPLELHAFTYLADF